MNARLDLPGAVGVSNSSKRKFDVEVGEVLPHILQRDRGVPPVFNFPGPDRRKAGEPTRQAHVR